MEEAQASIHYRFDAAGYATINSPSRPWHVVMPCGKPDVSDIWINDLSCAGSNVVTSNSHVVSSGCPSRDVGDGLGLPRGSAITQRGPSRAAKTTTSPRHNARGEFGHHRSVARQ